jgi:hypothetical protein
MMINPIKELFKKLKFNKSPELVFIDVDTLYHNTLYYSSDFRPWAVRDGKYVALELRRQFAEDYLNNSVDFECRNTNYYKFVQNYIREGFAGIYDGNQNYAMVNPDNVCKRYISLIDSIVKNIEVYNSLNRLNIINSMESIYDDIIEFERTNKREAFYLNQNEFAIIKESTQYETETELLKMNMERKLVGHLVPSGIMCKGILVVKNGSHRLALFKVLREKGVFTNKFAIYIIKRIKNGIRQRNIGEKGT